MSDEADDSPLAGRAYESASAGPSGTSERNIADQSAVNDEEDGEDVPNWIAFADYAKSVSKGNDKSLLQTTTTTTTSANPVIPKRGEKDFEPASVGRYIDLQQSLLEASRSALFSAISSGVRSHSSKSPNRAVWDPRIERAYMVPVADASLPPSSPINRDLLKSENASAGAVHGVHFLTMGSYVQERKRMELMPEEALYLVERGSIECWTSEVDPTVPFSVQHAWSTMINAEELTPERYQVYAFLRRLGYTVVRSQASQSPLNDHTTDRQLTVSKAIKWIKWCLATLFSPISISSRLIKSVVAPYTVTSLERLDSLARGYRKSLLGNERWFTYDQVFTSLQFVKAGRKATIGVNKRRTNPYRVFYNVYKPVTKYKKSDPPPPDFQLGAISAQTTPLPDLWDFQNIFAELGDVPAGSLSVVEASSSLASIWSYLLSYLQTTESKADSIKATSTNGKPRRPQNSKSQSLTRPAPYAKLKNGSKSAIIAVVDNGTISFQRFGKSGFEEFPWLGDGM